MAYPNKPLTCPRKPEHLNDSSLRERVADCFRKEVDRQQRPDPHEVTRLQEQQRKLSERIRFVLAHPGESHEDRRESEAVLRQLRQERAQVESKLSLLQSSRVIRVPTDEEIKASIDQMAHVLIAAVDSEDADSLSKARHVVELITGGAIYLTQEGDRSHGRGWLIGTFRPHLVDAICGSFDPLWTLSVQDDVPIVTIEYRRERTDADLRVKIMRLFDEGWQVNEIAKRLKVNRNRVASLIHSHQAEAGLQPIDLTKRRGEIQKRQDRALHKQIADRVMELYRQGKSYKEICTECQCSHPIVIRAIRFWHELRGLPVPDGRTRRKTLPRNQSGSKKGNSSDHAAPNSEAN